MPHLPSLPAHARRLPVFSALLIAAGCNQAWPEPSAEVHVESFGSEHEAWRSSREARAVEPPGGPVLWIGLWELPMGATSFGSDPSLPITLPDSDAPALAGTLYRSDEAVYVVPAESSPLSLHEGDRVTERTRLRHDREPTPSRLSLGSLGLRVHSEPGTSRLWLRAWDEDHPARRTFRLPEYYPLDPSWRVPARFDAFREPKPLRIPDVTGGTIELLSLGVLVFRRDDREFRLIATGRPTGTSFQVMLWDSTAVDETYQGGRYLRVERPDSGSWTTIDFNRAYNAPCVFTPWSVCGVPPEENHLPIRIEAGEKRPSPARKALDNRAGP